MITFKTATDALAAANNRVRMEGRDVMIFHGYDEEGSYWILNPTLAEQAAIPNCSLATTIFKPAFPAPGNL